MKKLIFIGFVILSVSAHSQGIFRPFVGNYLYDGLKAGDYFLLPADTILTTATNVSPCDQMAKVNGIVYHYSCIEQKWIPLSTGNTSIPSLQDVTSVGNITDNPVGIGFDDAADVKYTLDVNGSAHSLINYVDTAIVVGTGEQYMDGVYRNIASIYVSGPRLNSESPNASVIVIDGSQDNGTNNVVGEIYIAKNNSTQKVGVMQSYLQGDGLGMTYLTQVTDGSNSQEIEWNTAGASININPGLLSPTIAGETIFSGIAHLKGLKREARLIIAPGSFTINRTEGITIVFANGSTELALPDPTLLENNQMVLSILYPAKLGNTTVSGTGTFNYNIRRLDGATFNTITSGQRLEIIAINGEWLMMQ